MPDNSYVPSTIDINIKEPISGDFRKSPNLYVPIPDFSNTSFKSNTQPIDTIAQALGSNPLTKALNFNLPSISTPTVYTERHRNSEIGYDALDPLLEEKYADKQGWFSRLANRTVKFGNKALITIGSGIISATDILLGNTDVDNPIITAINQDAEYFSRVTLPNYQPKYSALGTLIYKAGDLYENLGFSAGAIASAALIDIPVGILTEGIGDAILLPKQLKTLYKAFGEIGQASRGGLKEYEVLISTLNNAKKTEEGIMKALNSLKTFNKVSDFTRFSEGVLFSSQAEAYIQSNQNYITTKKELESRYLDEFGNFNGDSLLQDKINKTSLAAGNATFLPNFLFLAASNALGLQGILTPSKAAIRATQEALGERITLDVLNPNTVRAITKPFDKGFSGMLQRFSQPGNIIKDNLRESFEEGYQYIVSDANKNYYTKQFDRDSNNKSISLLDDYINSTGRLFTTEEGIENMVMGFLGGAVQGGFRRILDNNRGVLRGSKLASKIEENLNKYSATSIFHGARTETVTATSIINELEEAAKTGDIFRYKNAQIDSLFNFVNSGYKNNKFDARLEQLEKMKSLDKESFEVQFNIDFNTSNKKTVDNYIDAVINKANNIKDNIELIDNSFGKNPFDYKKNPTEHTAFEAYKGELAVSLTRQNDYKRRYDSIKQDINKDLNVLDFNDVTNLTSLTGVSDTITKFNKRINELKNSEKLAEGNKELTTPIKEEREFLERRVNELENYKKDNNIHNQDFLGTVNSIFNYYNSGNKVTNENTINTLKTLNILANSEDAKKLIDETTNLKNIFEKLATKEGLDNFTANYTKDLESYIDDLTIDENGKIKFKTIESEKAPEVINKERENLRNKTLQDLEVATEDELKDLLNNNQVRVTPQGFERVKEGESITEQEKEEALKSIEHIFEDQFPEGTDEEGRANPPSNTSDSVRDKVQNTEDEELVKPKTKEEKEKQTEENKNKEQTIYDSVTNFLDNIWKSSLFKFYNNYNKINSWNKGKDRYLHNLIRTIKNNKDSDIIKSITFKVVKLDTKEQSTPYPFYENGVKTFTKLVTNSYKYDVEVYHKGKKIGVLQDPNRLGYINEENKFVSLGDIDDINLYTSLTKNDASTFEEFKKQHKAYKIAYYNIINSKKLDWTNKELLKIFTPKVSIGRLATTNKESLSTPVDKLQLSKGSAIIQYYNDGSHSILNASELKGIEIDEINKYLSGESTQQLLKSSGKKFFVLSKTPNGNFSNELSLIYANPIENKISSNTDMVGFIKSDETNIDEFTITYPTKDKGTVRISFSKNNNEIIATLKNQKLGVSQDFIFTQEDIDSLEDNRDFAIFLNDRLQNELRNPILINEKINLSPKNFNLTSLSPTNYKSSLSAAVSTPQIYTGFAINFYPNSLQQTQPTSTKAAEKTTEQKVEELKQIVESLPEETPIIETKLEPILDDEGNPAEIKKTNINKNYYQGIPKTTSFMQGLIDEEGNELIQGSVQDVENFKKQNGISETNVKYVDLDIENPDSLINKFLNKDKVNLINNQKENNKSKNEKIVSENYANIIKQLEDLNLITRTGC